MIVSKYNVVGTKFDKSDYRSSIDEFTVAPTPAKAIANVKYRFKGYICRDMEAIAVAEYDRPQLISLF